MNVRVWGSRAGLPRPLNNRELEEKLIHVMTSGENTGALDFPKRETYGGNTSCVSVIDDSGQLFLFDAGTGIRVAGLAHMAGQLAKGVSEFNIFITYTGWDHLQGYPFFVPAYIPGKKVFFYSPLVGIKKRLYDQQIFSHFPIRVDQTPGEKSFFELGSDERVKVGKTSVWNFNFDPSSEYVSYLLESGQKKIGYATGSFEIMVRPDAEKKYSENFSHADVVFVDLPPFLPGKTYDFSIRDFMEKIMAVSSDVGVQRVWFNHFSPEMDDTDLFDEEKHLPTISHATHFTGEAVFAAEMKAVDL